MASTTIVLSLSVTRNGCTWASVWRPDFPISVILLPTAAGPRNNQLTPELAAMTRGYINSLVQKIEIGQRTSIPSPSGLELAWRFLPLKSVQK